MIIMEFIGKTIDKETAIKYKGKQVILHSKLFGEISSRAHKGIVVSVLDNHLTLKTKQGNIHNYYYYNIGSIKIDKNL